MSVAQRKVSRRPKTDKKEEQEIITVVKSEKVLNFSDKIRIILGGIILEDPILSMINENDLEKTIQVIDMIKKMSYQGALLYLRQNGYSYFDNKLPINQELISKANNQDEIFINEIIINENNSIKCPSCGSSNVAINEKQTRAADEPVTVRIDCFECGKKTYL